MCKFIKWFWNLFTISNFFDNYMELYNMKEYIEEENSKANYICHICSYNMRNTRYYEFGCVNYGQYILPEFFFIIYFIYNESRTCL